MFDIAVAVFVGLLSPRVIGRVSLPAPAAASLIVAPAGALLVRRVWPMPVFAWCLAVSVVGSWWSPWFMWSPALIVALYTLATLRAWRAVLAAACAQTLTSLPALESLLRGALQRFLPGALPLLAVTATATMLGLFIGARRALLEQLRARAERLERERDQEALLAAAAERARIAHEMHDIVAHHLTVMVALADGAAARSATDPEAAEAMHAVSATGRRALSDTRHLLGVLHEPEAGEAARSPLPAIADLDALVERVRAAGLPVRYEIEGAAPSVSPSMQLTLYRLVQEALTNTMKHAGPGASAFVRVRYTDVEINVDVEDDGCGQADAAPGPGRGLAGMRERVHVFGGEVRTGPRTPRGWAVSARLRLEGAGQS
jgi:signal transduction histidine kinase